MGLTDVVQISDGETYSCALKSDGTVVCWGNTGALYIPSNINHDILEVSVGAGTMCVLQSNGKMHCIGDNSIGSRSDVVQMSSAFSSEFCYLQSDNTVKCRQNTPPVDLASVTKVMNNDSYACALKSDGTVVCW